MKNALQVTVTAHDIRETIPDGVDNPVARALERATGTNWDIIAGHRYAYESGSPFRLILLPAHVIDIISRWRSSQAIEPFKFSCEFYLRGESTNAPKQNKNRAQELR